MITVRANLRPSQAKLDRLEAAAIRAPDQDIDAAIRRLERAGARARNRNGGRRFAGRCWEWLRKRTWAVSLHLGVISIQNRPSSK